jgi:hypothetical protein
MKFDAVPQVKDPARMGAGGLARRPQRGLSAGRPDRRRAPRGRGRMSRA